MLVDALIFDVEHVNKMKIRSCWHRSMQVRTRAVVVCTSSKRLSCGGLFVVLFLFLYCRVLIFFFTMSRGGVEAVVPVDVAEGTVAKCSFCDEILPSPTS